MRFSLSRARSQLDAVVFVYRWMLIINIIYESSKHTTEHGDVNGIYELSYAIYSSFFLI